MANTVTSFSTDVELAERVRAEARETGLKMSTIITQALRARYAAQDAKAA
jgi:predicted transcriptional regulator